MRRANLAALLSLAPIVAQADGAGQRALTAYLPAETVLLVECDDLRAFLDATLALADPLPAPAQLGQIAITVAVAATLGTTLHGAIADLAPAQVAFAVVVPEDGRPVPVLLAKVVDEARARARAARLTGVGTFVGDGLCALFQTPAHAERWRRFVASDRPRLTRKDPVAAATPGLRAWVDVARLRRERPLYETLDPGGRFFFGPLAAALDRAAQLHLALSLDADGLRLDADLDGTALGMEPATLLCAAGVAPRPGLVTLPSALATLELDRSLRGYLQNLDALLPEPVATRVRGEAANLDLIIGGGSFVDELLGGVAEPMQFVVVGAGVPEPEAREPTDDDAPARPRIELPGFALLAKVETERAEQLLHRGFYRFAAILSAQRAMQQLPPRLPQVVRDGDLRLHVMRGPAFQGVGEPPTSEQIEATLVFAHGHAVLASTLASARQVVAALGDAAPAAVQGDRLSLRGGPIADYLQRNAGALALGRVLDEGESLAQARRFVDGLVTALALVERLDLHVEPGPQRTRAHLSLRRAPR